MPGGKLIYENLDEESNAYLSKFGISPLRTGFLKCKGCIVPQHFQNFGDQIKNMQVRNDDIWVCTFPKSGTTWVQEMVWCISNDLNFKAAKQVLESRFPYLEQTAIFDMRRLAAKHPEINFTEYLKNSVDYVDKISSPRFIKTHLPFNLLPEKLQNNSTSAKIIHVTRNPKDTCLSYYHQFKMMRGNKASFECLAEAFLTDNLMFTPYANHLKGYWRHQNNPNILFLKYEEMKKDLKSVIYKTANFIGKTVNEDEVQKLLHHLAFSSMKENNSVNYQPTINYFKKYKLIENASDTFMRRGIVGEWKEVMSSNLCERFEKWEEENLKDIDFSV